MFSEEIWDLRVAASVSGVMCFPVGVSDEVSDDVGWAGPGLVMFGECGFPSFRGRSSFISLGYFAGTSDVFSSFLGRSELNGGSSAV